MSIQFGPAVLLPELQTCPICFEVVSGAAYEGPNCITRPGGGATHSMHRDCAISYVEARKIDAPADRLAQWVACPTCGRSLYVLDGQGRIVRDEFRDPPGLEARREQARARQRAGEAEAGERTARQMARAADGED